MLNMFRYFILMFIIISVTVSCVSANDEHRLTRHNTGNNITVYEELFNVTCLFGEIDMTSFATYIVPRMEGKYKGQNGKICIIGSSTEYTGAPYFAAISALKVGADLVYVITTESAAPAIKSYSPDLIVYPYLSDQNLEKIIKILLKMDVVVIGPGLGREPATMNLIFEVFDICRDLKKPLVVDADGLYAIFINKKVLKEYPSPGVILTPNHHESKVLMQSVAPENTSDWQRFWGKYVSVLMKGKKDDFFSHFPGFGWTVSTGGSARRAGGQGDILSGFIATFYNWALKANICPNHDLPQLAHSIATYAAAKIVRLCNFKAFEILGRSMTASDMLIHIHEAFEIATVTATTGV